MSSAANTLLAFIIIALGFLGVTMSFLISDKKKSNISLGLAILVIVTGLYQMVDQSYSRFRLNQRLKEIQRDQQINLDDLRQKMKAQSNAVVTPVVPAPAKKK